jgi:hypothetical protein
VEDKSNHLITSILAIEEAYAQHIALGISSLTWTNPVSENLLGYRLVTLAYQSLFRSTSLITGFLTLHNAENNIGMRLMARSHMETTGFIIYVYTKLNDYYAGKLDRDKLDDLMFRLSLGSKVIRKEPNDDGAKSPNPIHVLDLIRSFDNWWHSVGQDNVPFMDGYEWLCEFCHPNWASHSIYTNIVGGTMSFDDKVDQLDDFIGGFAVSVTSFLFFFNKLIEIIKINEPFPDIQL